MPRDLPAVETARRIKDQGGIVSIPHPFDRFRRSVIRPSALLEILPLADIVEVFNARNVFDRDNQRARDLADQHNLLATAVSDSHTPWEPGNTYVEMPEFDGTPEDFKRALAEGRVVGRRMSPLIHVLTTLTKLRKRLVGTGPPSG